MSKAVSRAVSRADLTVETKAVSLDLSKADWSVQLKADPKVEMPLWMAVYLAGLMVDSMVD